MITSATRFTPLNLVDAPVPGASAQPPYELRRAIADTSPGSILCGRSLGKRIRLNAALAKTKSQSTFARPRNLILGIQAIVFSQPNASLRTE